MRYILNKYHYRIPSKAIIDDLRLAAKRLGGKSISSTDYDTIGSCSSRTASTRFGSWNAAIKKAGLEINKPDRVSKKELLANLKRVWNSLKRQPLTRDMRRPLSAYSYRLYATNFGTWRRALEYFVSTMPGEHYPPLIKTSKKKKRLRKHRTVTKSLRYDILKRDNYRCRLCGASPAIKRGVTLHIDHIIPLSAGGKSVPENLQTLCSDCNYGKGIKKQ